MSLSALVHDKRILVVVGSGGVGKTTCSAALGMSGALRGRKTLVLTIDPARRLASSMGLEKLDHVARPVDVFPFALPGISPAPLFAMMLDVRRTFDELVARFAPDEQTRAKLYENRIYQQIAGRLAGSHEYAAMEKLRALDAERQYDLIVLDTPPSRNALDFLEAPQKIAEAIDSPALQWLIRASARGATGLGLAGSFVLRRLARFLGSRFLSDIGGFLAEFNLLLGGFHQRAEEVQALFHDPALAFVMVASPEAQAIDDALFLAKRLHSSGLPVGGWIVNRVCPMAQGGFPVHLATELAHLGVEAKDQSQVVQVLSDAWQKVDVLAQADASHIRRLRGHTDSRPLLEIPLFDQDVHDLRGLRSIAQRLLPEADWRNVLEA